MGVRQALLETLKKTTNVQLLIQYGKGAINER